MPAWRRGSGVAALMLAAGAGGALTLTARVLRAQRAAVEHMPERADALVVFGAEARPDGPSGELRDRLEHAIGLWQGGRAPLIVVSGGVDAVGDEVQAMESYLTGRGVPSAAVVPGRPGQNTRQTVRTMARLGDELGVRSWIAVTTPFHARRVLDESRRRRLSVVVSGPGTSPEMRHARRRRVRVATEVVASVFYALPEPISARVSTAGGTWRHTIPLRLARESG